MVTERAALLIHLGDLKLNLYTVLVLVSYVLFLKPTLLTKHLPSGQMANLMRSTMEGFEKSSTYIKHIDGQVACFYK